MSSTPPTQLAWLKKFAEEHPLILAWNAVLLCGGLLLLSYHTSLFYMPDFSLGDLAGLLASVTFIGIFVVAVFLFSCFFPGLALRCLEGDWPLPAKQRYFNSNAKQCVLMMLPILLWGVHLFVPEYLGWKVLDTSLFALIVAGASFATAMAFSYSSIRTLGRRWWKHLPVRRHTVGLFLWTLLFAFPLEIALLFATSGDLERKTSAAIEAVIVLVLYNGVVYLSPKGKVWLSLGLGGLSIMVLLLLSNQSLFMPQSIVQVLSLGDRNAATLTVSGKSCHALARFGVRCSADDVKDGSIELENVNVLSRVGTSILIELLVKQNKTNGGLPSERTLNGLLSLNQPHSQLYCSPTEKTREECSTCDSLLLQRANLPGKPNDEQLKNYRNDLLCVQLIIPKDEVLSMALSGKRHYRHYSAFSLLPEIEEKKDEDKPAEPPKK